MADCRICGNADANKSHTACEMMFGYRDEFEYLECAKCGCLQIKAVPADLSKYYPENYYSYHMNGQSDVEGRTPKFLKRQRLRHYLGKKNVVGALSLKLYKLPKDFFWLRKIGLDLDSEIMEVGCGSGKLLLQMRAEGFSRLTGVDPFIEKDVSHGSELKILKKEIAQVTGQFDFIMLHHSFEHIPEQLITLKRLYELLKPERYILLRIPVVAFAWRNYGVHWVGLDAPRHLYLHTQESMQILANQAGFEIKSVKYDSDLFQFLGSEQYLKDIPLTDERSYFVNPGRSIFAPEQIESFKKQSADLNENNDGHCACFYLYKARG